MQAFTTVLALGKAACNYNYDVVVRAYNARGEYAEAYTTVQALPLSNSYDSNIADSV